MGGVVGRRIVGISVPNESAVKDVRTRRRQVAKPRGPRAIVGDPAERRHQAEAILVVAIFEQGRCLMDDGLVESGAPASCLIDQIGRNPFSHEIRVPAFPPVRRGLQTSCRMRGPMNHDDRRRVALFVYRCLELNIHLADRDLVGEGHWVGIRRRRYLHRRVLCDFRHATDEEAALVFNHQWFGQEFFRLLLLCVDASSDH